MSHVIVAGVGMFKFCKLGMQEAYRTMAAKVM